MMSTATTTPVDVAAIVARLKRDALSDRLRMARLLIAAAYEAGTLHPLLCPVEGSGDKEDK
jgi:hypothetical protein